ncbi:hypothetical protein [Kocuria sp.]|uniref:hypothetical protein n=1 Tax=Kocuria sp. TaxID=1871328 RepID=UPI0026DADDCF|nr:hypothetical protein [Kocuria sp.]MDO4919924.1 hypothetical protein [Kocuria sp.]
MTETPAQPTAVPLGHTAQIMLRQLAEHQDARPFDPDNVGDALPEYEVARMDEWQRLDSAMRLVMGSVLTREALRAWQEATP